MYMYVERVKCLLRKRLGWMVLFRVQDVIGKNLVNNKLVNFRTRLWLDTLLGKYYLLKLVKPFLKYLYKDYLKSLYPQKELIYRRGYDVLIVLDACRFDVFSQVVHKYLDGRLIPVKSPASVTIDWLQRVWKHKRWRDLVYVSASPMINKRGFIKGFDARKHFMYIEEVWDWGWNRELSTVPPNMVNFAVKLTIAKLKMRRLKLIDDYRMVIHYVQPHAPYIMFRNITRIISKSDFADNIGDIALRKFGYLTGKFAIDYVLLSVLKEHIGDVEKINAILRRAYEENLHWVLRYVARLVTEIPGKIVITADHGELLGEYGLYFHMDLPLPQLRVVPWFLVK